MWPEAVLAACLGMVILFQFETDFPTWMGSRSVCPLCLTALHSSIMTSVFNHGVVCVEFPSFLRLESILHVCRC